MSKNATRWRNWFLTRTRSCYHTSANLAAIWSRLNYSEVKSSNTYRTRKMLTDRNSPTIVRWTPQNLHQTIKTMITPQPSRRNLNTHLNRSSPCSLKNSLPSRLASWRKKVPVYRRRISGSILPTSICLEVSSRPTVPSHAKSSIWNRVNYQNYRP